MLLPLLAEGLIMVMGDGAQTAFAVFLQRFPHGDFKQEVINISPGTVVVAIALSVVLSKNRRSWKWLSTRINLTI